MKKNQLPFDVICIILMYQSYLFLVLVDVEITSEEERSLLLSSEDEVGSQLDINSMFIKSERKFKFTEINSRAYHKEVRRQLYTNMDLNRKPKGIDYHSFCRRFERERGLESKCTKPDFDAWCLVIGKCRDAFDAKKFFKLYSTARSQLEYIRNMININVSENF